MKLLPVFDLAFCQHAAQHVDSALATTRIFWREKMGASEAEARDPRPFLAVLAERTIQQPEPADLRPKSHV